jgi:hypothetical protein
VIDMTNCKHEKELVCIECNADMTIKEMLDEARADERRIEGTRLYTMYLDELEIAKKEAYAKGKADGTLLSAKGATEAYKCGQADLIEKLTSRDVVGELAQELADVLYEYDHHEAWKLMDDAEKGDMRRQSENILRAAIKKASESASERRDVVVHDTVKTAPEKPSGAVCGGRHHFKTKAEAVKHAKEDYEACIDCWAGTPWEIDKPENAKRKCSHIWTGNKETGRFCKWCGKGGVIRETKPENAKLDYCPNCNQMTNQSDGQCLRCDSMNKTKPEAPEQVNKSNASGRLTSGRADALPSRQTLRSLTAPENTCECGHNRDWHDTKEKWCYHQSGNGPCECKEFKETKPENACGCGDDSHATHRILNKPENACKHEWSYMDMSCLKCGITKPENAKEKEGNDELR